MNTAVQNKTTKNHKGFGKVILFGEHVVVYGAPAIVAAVAQYTACELTLTKGKPGWVVDDHRPAVPGYIVKKAEEQKLAHKLVFDHLKIDLSKDGLSVRLGGGLVPSSGIGASASDVVSLSRALSEMYNLNLTEEQVNLAAFTGEGGYHGTPSGVDNTAATFGGLLEYRREAGKSHFAKIQFREPLWLVVVGTGITASTTNVVGDVRKLRETQPKKFAQITKEYNEIVAAASAAIANGDLRELGRLMNRNHSLLQQLTVSCDELESIVNRSRELGALGAKLSGTGRGGIAVALCTSEKQQIALAEGLTNTCPAAKFVWKYSCQPTVGAKL